MAGTAPRQPQRATRGLVLPRLDGIGDFWLWLPLVQTIRKAVSHPIHLVANALWVDLAQATGLFDRITPIDPRRLRLSPRYRQRLWRSLASAPAECLWHTTPRRRIAAEDSLAWFWPASQRIAFAPSRDADEPSLYRRWVDKQLYQQLVPVDSEWEHEWTRYQRFAQHMGLGAIDLSIYERLRESWLEIPKTEPFIAVLLGAGASFRLPSLSLWRDTLQLLHEQTRWPIWLLGSSAEEPLARALQTALPFLPLVNYTGQTRLLETLAYIKAADLILGPETGLVHVAITWQKPTIVFMGGGHWGRFLPYPAETPFPPPLLLHELMPCYQCGWHCVHTLSHQAPYPCIQRLSTKPLAAELPRLLTRITN